MESVPQPTLDAKTIDTLCNLVAEFITQERARYLTDARPLDSTIRKSLEPFFRKQILDNTLFSPARPRLRNPDFYPQLKKMGVHGLVDFSAVAAITYNDVIVHQEKLSPRLAFHELVHAEQYSQLGLEGFVRQYILGFLNEGSYEAIPLEAQAYALDTQFHVRQNHVFSVQEEVKKLQPVY